MSNLAKLKICDDEILGQAVELIKRKQFKNMNTLTNVVYSCAKLSYVHLDTEGNPDYSWIDSAMD